MDLLTRQNFEIRPEEDRVVLHIGTAAARMPYASAHRIAARLRLHGKAAFQAGNQDHSAWRDVAKEAQRVDMADVRARPLGDGKAHSKPTKQVPIFLEGSLVVMQLGGPGGVELKFEPETAIEMATLLQHAAREAGRWAGDEGGGILAMGRLTDAAARG